MKKIKREKDEERRENNKNLQLGKTTVVNIQKKISDNKDASHRAMFIS